MKKTAYKLWDEELNQLKIGNICFYKEDTQGFIEFFSNLKETEKKSVLKAIFNCSHDSQEIIAWLDENYSGIIREVGLSL